MAEKSTSSQKAYGQLKDRLGFIDIMNGTPSLATGIITWPTREINPATTRHVPSHWELEIEDTITTDHDEIIRDLAKKLAEARRDLESLLKVESAPVPDAFILSPIQVEEVQVVIREVEQAKFRFIEDD